MKIGYVNSSFDFQPAKGYVIQGSIDSSSKSNIYLNAGLNYRFYPYISTYASFGIAGLGAENLTMFSSRSLHFTTLLIPVGAKFYPVERFAISAGFNLGFILIAIGQENGKKVKYDNFSTANHSFGFGIEGYFTKKIFAEAKYNIGLSDIYLTNDKSFRINNNFWQIGIGYVADTWQYNNQ
jgi:Outer membrane protein beta-barrel domain